jgi:hypothetical protein
MSIKLQTEFSKFDELIKLKNIDDNQDLRDKRDMLVEELQNWLKKNKKPTVAFMNQGSYAMGTGIKSLEDNDNDYDIDVGLKFNLQTRDYPNAVEVKTWVEDALTKGNRTVEMMRPCVRVQYTKDEKPTYHVDLAVYGYNGEQLQLAKGFRGSSAENKYWEDSDPEKLKELLNDKFVDTEAKAQFKRIIRYLKRWKDYKFPTKGDAAPTGIALTAMCYEWFEPNTEKWNGDKEINDLEALKDLLIKICSLGNNCGLDVRLPVKPENELCEKINASHNHVEKYKKKMNDLKNAVSAAFGEIDPAEAAKMLEKEFGSDFPIPDKSDTGEQSKKAGIVSSTESA